PVIYIALAFVFWMAYFIYKKQTIFKNSDFINSCVTTFLIIGFNIQPNIIQGNFNLFQCTNLYRNDSPLYYLNSNYDVQCWTSEHRKWTFLFATPLILFWAVVVPALLFLFLKKNKDKLEHDSVRCKYSFIYQGYRASKFYWEFVV